MLDTRYYGHLARLFSASVVDEIASRGRSTHVDYVLARSGYAGLLPKGVTLGRLFDGLYDFLRRNYRCEYVYKNALANKILLGRHSLNTSALLTEFRVGRSKADVVIVNGTSSAYEIKSELDSLGRLNRQLDSYRRVFDKVFVVTHRSQLGKVERGVGRDAGILLLTDRYTLKTVREARPNAGDVSPLSIFNCLRRDEYCQIVGREFGYVPGVHNSRSYAECKRLFASLEPAVAHRRMVGALRRRCGGGEAARLVTLVPHSLRLLCAAGRLAPARHASFLSALGAVYELK
ncbi:MAG: sce7726 family protein [Acidobacteriota bacterium]|nr:sce7726 family protein [Acidobacteriota bacterium]